MNSVINWDLVTLDELTSKRYGICGMYGMSDTTSRYEVLYPYLEKCYLFGTPDGRKELTVILKDTNEAKDTLGRIYREFNIRFTGILLTNISNIINSNSYIFNGIISAGEWYELDDKPGFVGCPKMHFDLIDPVVASVILKNATI
ncbi:MAG: hypothetical protein NC114_06450 [Ruminococcus flavefaciens]|nr:hypothetical protein [Ruminococcus flavefaciens]